MIRNARAEISSHRLPLFLSAGQHPRIQNRIEILFVHKIKTIPNVIECSCVTGDYSMLIETAFQSTEQLDHFINELQHFGKTKTLIAFSTSVEHRDVPIE